MTFDTHRNGRKEQPYHAENEQKAEIRMGVLPE